MEELTDVLKSINKTLGDISTSLNDIKKEIKNNGCGITEKLKSMDSELEQIAYRIPSR